LAWKWPEPLGWILHAETSAYKIQPNGSDHFPAKPFPV